MTTNEKVARRKLSLLELSKELNNVSKACKFLSYSCQQFYEISCNYQTYATNGWFDRLLGCKGVSISHSLAISLEDVLERAGNQGGVIDAVRRKSLKLTPNEGRTKVA